MVDVHTWHLASFRCDAEFGPLGAYRTSSSNQARFMGTRPSRKGRAGGTRVTADRGKAMSEIIKARELIRDALVMGTRMRDQDAPRAGADGARSADPPRVSAKSYARYTRAAPQYPAARRLRPDHARHRRCGRRAQHRTRVRSAEWQTLMSRFKPGGKRRRKLKAVRRKANTRRRARKKEEARSQLPTSTRQNWQNAAAASSRAAHRTSADKQQKTCRAQKKPCSIAICFTVAAARCGHR